MGVKTTRSVRKNPGRGRKRRRAWTVGILWRAVREGWRLFLRLLKAVWAAPLLIRLIALPLLLFLAWLGGNWAYQTFHKPTEIFFPLDQSLNKRPVQTWREYEHLFREHATAIIRPEFLAALAQVEGAGNPAARTYWRWQWSWNPLEWYQPASSAVGMYQITDGTFREARRYCIHNHVVVEDGPWHDLKSCWFNSLYTRVLPSHAIELTAAWLDRRVTQTLASRRRNATLRQKQDLAALIHLCGAGAGQAYAERKFRLTPRQRCGDHDVRDYLSQINTLAYEFARPAAGDKTIRQQR